VRESLFNILQNWLNFKGLMVLDLFAGTGALGLEALSRGAQHATFVENGRIGQKLIQQNIALLKASDRSTLLTQDATKLTYGAPCDLVFLDPPYGKSLGQRALVNALEHGWITPDTLIVFEEVTIMTPKGFVVQDTRKFGGTTLTLLSPL
jgi:16S rRNA (guanine966-N2)-methyltransferase